MLAILFIGLVYWQVGYRVWRWDNGEGSQSKTGARRFLEFWFFAIAAACFVWFPAMALDGENYSGMRLDGAATGAKYFGVAIVALGFGQSQAQRELVKQRGSQDPVVVKNGSPTIARRVGNWLRTKLGE